MSTEPAVSPVPGAISPPRDLARPRTLIGRRYSLAAAVIAMLVAGAIAYVWPSAIREVAADLRIEPATTPASDAIRRHLAAVCDPAVLQIASTQVRQDPSYLLDFWNEGTLGAHAEPSRGVIRLRVAVPPDAAASAQEWLAAWGETYIKRYRETGASTDDLRALQAQREQLASQLQQAEERLEQADAERLTDTTGDDLRRIQARITDAQDQYQAARVAADKAFGEWIREGVMTEDDAARSVDPRQLAEACAADALLTADIEQLDFQARLLQSELTAVDARVAPLLGSVTGAVAEASRQIAEATKAGGVDDMADAVDRVRRTLHEYGSQAERFAENWRSTIQSAGQWQAGQDAALILEAQRTLEQHVNAFLQPARDQVDSMARDVDSGRPAAGADATRLGILQNALNRALLPVRGLHVDLMAAVTGAIAEENHALTSARSAARDIGARVAARREEIRASLGQQARQNWREQHNARLAAAFEAVQKSAAAREAAAAELGQLQSECLRVVARAADLDAKRQNVRVHEQEVGLLRRRLAEVDARVAAASVQLRPSGDDRLSLESPRELDPAAGGRWMRSAAWSGWTGLVTVVVALAARGRMRHG